MAEWPSLIDEGDFSGAWAACLRQWAGRADEPEASWDMAEVEERWGDSLFFAGDAGASPHYHAARAALVPPGAQFSSLEENNRRMSAFERVMEKLRAIDPYGKPRPGHDCRPHPNSVEALPRTEFGRLFGDEDHWRHLDLGRRWREAGESLAVRCPRGARRAFAWSLCYFGLYNRAWSAHLPASRWDTDGVPEMMEVLELRSTLAETPLDPPLPAWVNALLAGDWRRALAEARDVSPAPEWRTLAGLLAEACRAANLEEQGRRLFPPGSEPARE